MVSVSGDGLCSLIVVIYAKKREERQSLSTGYGPSQRVWAHRLETLTTQEALLGALGISEAGVDSLLRSGLSERFH